MDSPELKTLVKNNPLAQDVFTVLSKRQREPRNGVMELRRLRYDLEKVGIKVLDEDFIEIFTELEDMGMGKVIKQKGKPPAFKWEKNMKEVSHKATTLTAGAQQRGKKASSASHVEINALLSPERMASFQVPDDLTPQEIDYLINLLKVKREH